MRAGNGYAFFALNQENEIVQHIELNPRRVIPTATIPPIYPLFLYGMYCVFGDGVHVVLFIELLQGLIGALCCVLLYQIVSLKFSRGVAVGAAAVFSIYPLLIYLCGQISAANLYLFINLILIYLLLKGEANRTTGWFYWAGVLFGLLLLARAEVILLLPLFILWVAYAAREHALHKIIAFAGLAGIVLLPWIYRNYRVFDAFVPLTTQGGYNLWQGQNPQATGTRSQYSDPPFHICEEAEAQIQTLEPDDHYELELNKIYQHEAIMFVKNNPGKALALALRKIVFFWGYYWGINFTYPGAASPLYWLPWCLIVPFFIVGLVLSLKEFGKYTLFYIYFMISSITAMVFFVIPRYRLFILPLVFPFAVHGISFFLQYVLRKMGRR